MLDGGGATRLFVVAGALTLENVVVQQFVATGGAGPIGVAASDGANAPAAPPGGNGGPGGSAGTATDGAPGGPGQGGAILIMPGGMMRADGVVFRGNVARGGAGGPAGMCNGPPAGQACGDGGAGGDGGTGANVASGTGGAGGAGGQGGLAVLASGGGPAGDGEGGAIYNAGDLWIVDCLFDGNLAAGGAGGAGDFGGAGGSGGSGGRGGNGPNSGRGGDGGSGGAGGKGGKGGIGGTGRGAAVFNSAGAGLSVTETTFAGERRRRWCGRQRRQRRSVRRSRKWR